MHNILRLFDVLPNLTYTTSETIRDSYLQKWYIRVASRVAHRLKIKDPRELGNIRRVSKPHKIAAQRQSPHQIENFVNASKALVKNRN